MSGVEERLVKGRIMGRIIIRAVSLALMLAAFGAPATAQIRSDAYSFLKAVRDQDVLGAKALFDKPGSTVVNSRDYTTGETGLHIVVKRRDVPWINFLAQAGSNLELRDNEGRTPLILAAQLGFVDGIRVLLANGADVNGTNSRGETALIYAVQARDIAATRALVEGGADPDQHDRFTGNSPRDYATRDTRGGPILQILQGAQPKKKASGATLIGPR